ncbi:hypothetical protein KM043_006072 [Ampulex compressa]|nr:hypothetical protein KM043_006072 [Ampulex compressa]
MAAWRFVTFAEPLVRIRKKRIDAEVFRVRGMPRRGPDSTYIGGDVKSRKVGLRGSRSRYRRPPSRSTYVRRATACRPCPDGRPAEQNRALGLEIEWESEELDARTCTHPLEILFRGVPFARMPFASISAKGSGYRGEDLAIEAKVERADRRRRGRGFAKISPRFHLSAVESAHGRCLSLRLALIGKGARKFSSSRVERWQPPIVLRPRQQRPLLGKGKCGVSGYPLCEPAGLGTGRVSGNRCNEERTMPEVGRGWALAPRSAVAGRGNAEGKEGAKASHASPADRRAEAGARQKVSSVAITIRMQISAAVMSPGIDERFPRE